MKLKQPAQPVGWFRLPVITRPDCADTVVWPGKLTDLTPENLSDLLGKYTAMLAYVTHVAAEATAEAIKLEAEKAQATTALYVQEPRLANLDKWRRDLKLDALPEIEAVNIKLTTMKIRRTMAEAYISTYDRYIAALSRELSRRISAGEARMRNGLGAYSGS